MTDRISLLIKAKNLSAAQFADEIGVQRSSISHLMSGRNKPSLDLIQKTLQKFPEVSSEWLLFGKGEMVRELNLFDARARATGYLSGELSFDNEPISENEVVQTPLVKSQAYSPRTEAVQPEASGMINEQTTVKLNTKDMHSKTEQTQPQIAIRNEQVKDTGIKTIRKGKTIDQIIVLYDDQSFIAYSPGN
jgi:transcriptional regulator with XRE-family HTH domain